MGRAYHYRWLLLKAKKSTSTIQVVSGLELVILAIAAVGTAALTAVAGAGGGLILLIVILQFVDPLVAIPAHGVIQLVSNGTRAATLRADVDHALLRPYVLPLLPFAALGYLIADSIPRESGRALVGVFALVAVWWPAATAWLAPRPGGGSRFALVGALAGITNPTIGAPGPLLAPAFRAATSDHVGFVATFSVAQVLNHSAKIIVFAVAGFAWAEHLPMIVVGAVGVAAGTRVGTRFLRRADPDFLTIVFRIAVTAGAIRLLVAGIV